MNSLAIELINDLSSSILTGRFLTPKISLKFKALSRYSGVIKMMEYNPSFSELTSAACTEVIDTFLSLNLSTRSCISDNVGTQTNETCFLVVSSTSSISGTKTNM